MSIKQNTEDFGGAFEKIPVEKALFHPPVSIFMLIFLNRHK